MKIRRHLRGLGRGAEIEVAPIAPDQPIAPVALPRPDAATPAEKKQIAPKCIRMNKAARAREELGLTALPEVTRKFGEFMLEQGAKPVTPRDVVKAYVLTRSSVQRGGLTAEGLRKTWKTHPFEGKDIRPEDAFARLLQTPDGKTYLDEAQTGELSEVGTAAARRLIDKFKAFGLSESLFKEITAKAPELAQKAEELGGVLRQGSKAEWYAFAKKNIWGVGPAKKGFIAALLGRGDIPTADAREIEYWWLNRGKYQKHQLASRMDKFAALLERELAAMNLDTPPELRPFYQHLAHHAVWDAVGGSSTTHADVMTCMRLAGVAGIRGKRAAKVCGVPGARRC
jgi:hypothetical protein